jgi:hypothetical protein
MQPRTLDFDPDTPIRIGPSFETKLLFSLFAFKFRRKATHEEALKGTVFHYLNTPVGVSILLQPVDGILQPLKGIDMIAVKSFN